MGSAFANNLKAIRETSGLTLTAMAKALNLSLPTCSLYERGEREPTLTNLKRIATLFGVSADELLAGMTSLEDEQQERALMLKKKYDHAKSSWLEIGIGVDDEKSRGYVLLTPPECAIDEMWTLELKRSDFLKLTAEMNAYCQQMYADDPQLAKAQFVILARLMMNKRAAMRRENPFNLIGKMVPLEYLPTPPTETRKAVDGSAIGE